MINKRIAILFSIFLTLTTSCMSGTVDVHEFLKIHDLQGCNHISPFLGETVSNINGVVTNKEANGFTIQSVEEDEFLCTSEAIFVFTDDFPKVMRGDLVEVSGIVAEFKAGDEEDFNLTKTEIAKPKVRIIEHNYDLPEPKILDAIVDVIPREIVENDALSSFDYANDGLDYFESLESMLVQINNGIVVSPKNTYDEIFLIPESFRAFNLVSNTGALLITQQDRNPDKFMVKLPKTFRETINVGDLLTDPIVGIMDYSYGNYKINCLNSPEFFSTFVVGREIQGASDGLTMVTYNLENLSPFESDSRFEKIAKQIVDALKSPDILVLHEIMDSSGSDDDGVVDAHLTIQKLINEIVNMGGPSYQYSDPQPNNNQDGGMLGANIRSVLLFRQDKGISLDQPQSDKTESGFFDSRMIVHENPIRLGEYEKAFTGTRKPALWLMNYKEVQFVIIGFHLVSQNLNSPEWGAIQPFRTPEADKREYRLK